MTNIHDYYINLVTTEIEKKTQYAKDETQI